MPYLPFRRKQQTPAQKALETAQSALKVYTSLKVAQAGPKAAKAVAKGYAGAKGAKGAAKLAPWLAIPIIGVVVALVLKRRGAGQAAPADYSGDRAPASSTPPVSTGENAPAMGEPGGFHSATTTASPASPGGNGSR